MKNLTFIIAIALSFAQIPWASASAEKSYLADPSWAFGPKIPESGYYVEELGDGLYWLTDGIYQMMFLTTGQGVIVVDAPPNLGEKILTAISATTNEPITHVIYSHFHADHISAAGLYPKNATYIAQEATAVRLAKTERAFPFGSFTGGGDVPKPTVTFKENYTLTVGNQTLELEYKGPTHVPGNIFIYAPKQKVLMLIDVIFPKWSPWQRFAIAEDIPAYVESHDWAMSYDFDTLISGHLGLYATRQDVQTQKEYVLDIRTNAATALQTIDFSAVTKEVGSSSMWNMFGTWLEAVERKCADLTEEKWIGKLAGVDVVTQSHCVRMVDSLRID